MGIGVSGLFFINRFLDLNTYIFKALFPEDCCLCGNLLLSKEGRFICGPCWDKVNYVTGPVCLCCSKPFVSPDALDYSPAYLCGDCRKNPPSFEKASAVGYYRGVLKDIIHLFKYQGKRGLGRDLVKLMNQAYKEKWDGYSFDAIIPVPLHRKRLREREFDQALILAKGISKSQGIPLIYGNLFRHRWTESQTNLSKEERWRNVKGAFSLRNPTRVRDLRLLLIDDVYTTGATITECAKVLKKAKAKEVNVFTLARA